MKIRYLAATFGLLAQLAISSTANAQLLFGDAAQLLDRPPYINFIDTDIGIGAVDWTLTGADTGFLISNPFSDLVRLDRAADADSAIEVDANGDVLLQQMAFQFDRNEPWMGINRMPDIGGGNLQIGDSNPAISFQDVDEGPSGTLLQMNYQSESFGIGRTVFILPTVPAFLDVFSLSAAAPGNSLVIGSSGNVGIGSFANAALEVSRDDGSAQIRVEENDETAAPRDLFVLANRGNTKFRIEEVSSGVTWAFTNSGSDFRVSRQGSGVVEFAVDNAGNATLAGSLGQNSDRDAKASVAPVDTAEVLENVMDLAVSEWQYTDQPGVNHIGPMAQDFHAIFGVGASPEHISSLDTGGVALAAIQGLVERNRALERRNDRLGEDVALLREQLARQVARMQRLEAALEGLVADSNPVLAHQ